MKKWIQTNILFIHRNKPKITTSVIKNHYEWFKRKDALDKLAEIEKLTSFLKNPSIKERLYCILNDVTSKPTCWKCGKYLAFNEKQNNYKACCRKPRNADKRALKIQQEKDKNKNITLEEFLGLIHFKSKRKDSVSFEAILPSFVKDPYKWAQNANIPASVVDDFFARTDFLKGKYPVTVRARCLKEGITQIPICQNENCKNEVNFQFSSMKFSKYCSSKCSLTAEETLAKRKNTNLKKYGCENVFQNPKIAANIQLKNKNNHWKDSMKLAFKKRKIDLFESNYESKIKAFNDAGLKISNYTVEKCILTCKTCNSTFDVNDYPFLNNGLRCPFCFPKHESKLELTICNFLDELGVSYIRNDRKMFGAEIDILIPDYKIGIEVDGLLWHSFGKSKYSYLDNYKHLNKNVHLKKTILLEENGYQLLRFTDIEINKKIEIVKSIIKGKLQKHKTIFARKCEIRSLSSKMLTDFLEENHLHGSINSSIRYGLFYQNTLVMVISLGKSRFKKDEKLELYRLCTLKNTTVVGGFSKLLKHVKKEDSSNIMSFVDRRFSDGHGYLKVGFKLTRTTTPNYSYLDQNKYVLIPRYKAQKHKLHKILGDKFDDSKTEKCNMINEGYRIYFDCGNYVFEL